MGLSVTARADGGDLPGASVAVSALATGDNLPIHLILTIHGLQS
jgi:hypothetical protein